MAWDYVYDSPIDYLINTQTEKVKYEMFSFLNLMKMIML